MPNLPNKDRKKVKDKNELSTTKEISILTQQAGRRQRLQQIAEGHRRGEEAQTKGVHSPRRLRSAKELLEETRQRLNLVEKTREEFLNLYTPRGKCPNGREVTRTARSAERARVWSDLFVPDTPDERIQAENRTSLENFSSDSTKAQNNAEENNAEA